MHRNVALGKGCRGKTVRDDSMNKANNPFRTELRDIISGKHKIISRVRNKIFLLDERYRTDDFLFLHPTQGDTPASFALG